MNLSDNEQALALEVEQLHQRIDRSLMIIRQSLGNAKADAYSEVFIKRADSFSSETRRGVFHGFIAFLGTFALEIVEPHADPLLVRTAQVVAMFTVMFLFVRTGVRASSMPVRYAAFLREFDSELTAALEQHRSAPPPANDGE